MTASIARPPSSRRPAHRQVAAGGLGGLAKQRQAEAGLLAGLGREEGVGRLLGAHVEAGPVVFDRRSTARRAAPRSRRARRLVSAPARSEFSIISRIYRDRSCIGDHPAAAVLDGEHELGEGRRFEREGGGHAAHVFEVVAVGRAYHRQPVGGAGGRRRGAGRRVARQLDGVEAGLVRKEAELGDDAEGRAVDVRRDDQAAEALDQRDGLVEAQRRSPGPARARSRP